MGSTRATASSSSSGRSRTRWGWTCHRGGGSSVCKDSQEAMPASVFVVSGADPGPFLPFCAGWLHTGWVLRLGDGAAHQPAREVGGGLRVGEKSSMPSEHGGSGTLPSCSDRAGVLLWRGGCVMWQCGLHGLLCHRLQPQHRAGGHHQPGGRQVMGGSASQSFAHRGRPSQYPPRIITHAAHCYYQENSSNPGTSGTG